MAAVVAERRAFVVPAMTTGCGDLWVGVSPRLVTNAIRVFARRGWNLRA